MAERALPLEELSQDAFDEILEEAKVMYKKVEEEFQNQPGLWTMLQNYCQIWSPWVNK